MEQAFQQENKQGWRSQTYCSDLSLSFAYISIFGLKIGSTTKQWTVVKSYNSVVLNLFNLRIVKMIDDPDDLPREDYSEDIEAREKAKSCDSEHTSG